MPTIVDREETVTLGEAVNTAEPGPLPPIAPDGGFAPGLVDPTPPLPKAVPENFVCLRGPCAYYLEVHGAADVVTIGFQAVQVSRYCRATPGVLLDLTENIVFNCSAWDPTPDERYGERDRRRAAYLSAHPECVAADRSRVESRLAALKELDDDAADPAADPADPDPTAGHLPGAS